MTQYEKNPYYYGIGKYKGDESYIYYDYHKKEWSVERMKDSQVIEDVNCDDIEMF